MRPTAPINSRCGPVGAGARTGHTCTCEPRRSASRPHAAHTPIVVDALRRTGALSGDLLNAGEQWTAQLTAFTGALTRIDAAEQAAEEARAAAAAAEQRAADRRATAARDGTAAAIAASRQAADKAAAAQQRAKASEREAWRATGEHEAERARARAQQDAAIAAERADTAERDALQGVLEAERRQGAAAADDHDWQIATLHTALAECTADLEQTRDDLKTAGS
ncbi:hypothetical protein ACSDR0_48935 [Streptosporangium sp. G11]|uniref:hypothetical protein n=1 Tax=Streptosporangium sp. G11 TaxID=3436926 RepID=UPI003EBD4E71